MRVLIATPAFGGMVTTNFMRSMIQTLIWCHENQIAAEVMTLDNESLITRGRNRCATQALKQGFDKLFFIDADIIWKPLQFGRVLLSDQKIVGGTYPMKAFPLKLNFNAFEGDFDELDYRDPKNLPLVRKAANEETQELSVKHLPTGFMCIDREVLEKLKDVVPSYTGYNAVTEVSEDFYDFFPVRVVDGTYESEDWAFCSLARENGFSAYLDTLVIVAHSGTHHYGLELLPK